MNWNDFKKLFSDCEIIGNKIILRGNFIEALKFLQINYTYKILKQIVAIDRIIDGIELIYHLYSIEDEETLFISVFVKDEAESVVDIFPSAQADENEIFDLFGINFIGNKNLKRLYMPDAWLGHPLRKDYVQNDERLDWNDKEYS